MATYYLQEDGSTTIFSLDVIADLDLDLPKSDYKLVDTLSEGGIVTGTGVKMGRVIECSYNFSNNKELEREDFLDWFTRTKDIAQYMYKDVRKRIRSNLTNGSTVVDSLTATSELSTGNAVVGIGVPSNTIVEVVNTTSVVISNAATATLVNSEVEYQTFIGRLQVFPSPRGGEAYKSINISDAVKFSLISPNPYFVSTSVTEILLTSSGSAEYSTTVTIRGRRTPAIYDFTGSSDAGSWSLLQVKTAEDYGFRVDHSFSSTDNVIVDTRNSDLSMTVNGNTINNAFFATSTPFYLERGENTLIITAVESTTGGFKIQYNERRL